MRARSRRLPATSVTDPSAGKGGQRLQQSVGIEGAPADGRQPRSLVKRPLKVALALGIMALIVKVLCFELCRVEGRSMEPTLRQGDVYLISKVAYWFSEPQRGDIVSLHPTGVPDQVVKRVIGVPGDTIQISAGVVWLNGEAQDERYVRGPTEAGNLSVPHKVQPSQVVLLGDNRPMSDDSRSWDGVSALHMNIVGKLVAGPVRLPWWRGDGGGDQN